MTGALPLLNAAEYALTQQPPVSGQTPVNATAVNAAKASIGATDVPNSLLSGVAGTAGAVGQIAGGLASALAAPMPSLTANVAVSPSVKFGDSFVPNAIGESMAGKVGSFAVSSGNSNAEARGQLAQGFSMPWWGWVLIAVGGVGLIWFLRRTK